MIYYNNCLTSQLDKDVLEAMLPYFKENFLLPSNYIEKGEKIASQVFELKKIMAKSINATTEEIIFTSGGTMANNLGIKGFLLENSGLGNHIICSVIDYPDLLLNAAFFEESGFEVSYISCDEKGYLNLEELEEAIQDNTVLFMTTLVNHTTGVLQPIKKINAILKKANHKIYTFVDACEAFGKIPLDVKEDNIDMLSVSAHKIHGPKGIGFLYKKKDIRLKQIIHGINRVDDFNPGGISIALLAGFAKAIEIAFENFAEKIAYLRELKEYFWNKINSNIEDVSLNSGLNENSSPHHLNISLEYIEGESVMMMLSMFDIIVATGSSCQSDSLAGSYVLKAMGKSHTQTNGSIKFTLSKFITKKDIDYSIEKLSEIVKELRRRSPLNPN